MMFLLVRLSWGSLYSVYLSSTLSMSVDAYWYSLLLLLKMMSAISQSHSTLSSYAFFITPNLRLLKVTCQHQPMREHYTTPLLNQLVLMFSLLNEESRQKSCLWPFLILRNSFRCFKIYFWKRTLAEIWRNWIHAWIGIEKKEMCTVCESVSTALEPQINTSISYLDINNSQLSYNTLDQPFSIIWLFMV